MELPGIVRDVRDEAVVVCATGELDSDTGTLLGTEPDAAVLEAGAQAAGVLVVTRLDSVLRLHRTVDDAVASPESPR